jgi:translation initiation factor eIF-2B subunit delta
MVAMLAKENRIPVVACCETYKFGDKIVLDAVTGNEKGDSELLSKRSKANATPEAPTLPPSLTQLNLLYDLTPPSLITAVCTELGFIPPSSVPTVIFKGDAEPL